VKREGRCGAGWTNEQLGGVDYLMYIRDLAKRVETDWDSIKADLQELQQLVLAVEVCTACVLRNPPNPPADHSVHCDGPF
jgi:Zn-dependent M16 (insulinase) family peptidase